MGRLIDLQIQELELKQSLNDTSREELLQLEQLKAAREEIESARLRETREIANQRSSILKGIRDEEERVKAEDNQRRIDEEKRVEDEIFKKMLLKQE